MRHEGRSRDASGMTLKYVVFYGSVRTDRMGIRAARFITDRIRSRSHDVVLIDPAEYRLSLLDKMYKEYEPGDAPETLQPMADAIVPADGYFVVSGEYNHGVPPALSNLMDHFLEEYAWKPSAIVSYSAGSFGGVRAAMALHHMLAEMGMSSIPSTLPVPTVQDAFDESGQPSDATWYDRADRFLDEMDWYARALQAARGPRPEEACPERAQCDQA